MSNLNIAYKSPTDRLALGDQLKYRTDGLWFKENRLGYEGAAEYLASEILKYSNISNFVTYDMVTRRRDGREIRACMSPDFMLNYPSNVKLTTIFDLFNNLGHFDWDQETANMSVKEKILFTVRQTELLTGLTNVGPYLTQVLEFDALIRNEDRHLRNIALICHPMRYEFAPLFDNGAAFMSDVRGLPPEYEMGKLVRALQSKPFSTSFEEQVEVCRSLYGPQLQISPEMDLSDAFWRIETEYSPLVAERMQAALNLGKSLHPDFFNGNLAVIRFA